MSYLKKTQTLVRNGYGVETTPEYLAEFFPAYDHATRAKILNDMDAATPDEGDSDRDIAADRALRWRLEAVHQALMKAGVK